MVISKLINKFLKWKENVVNVNMNVCENIFYLMLVVRKCDVILEINMKYF